MIKYKYSNYRGSSFMKEQKISVVFEPSYTLDVLNFLDHLFTPRLSPNEQMLCHFEEYLGDYSEGLLQKIRKNLNKFESISEVLIPLITADPEFNDLKLSELLASPKYLINQYKSTSAYEGATKTYKKFLKNDAESMILQVNVLINELEKAKFKTYWLQSCLPLVNQQIKIYEQDVLPLSVSKKIGQSKQHFYVLSCIEPHVMHLIHQKLIISHQYSMQSFVYQWIKNYLMTECPLIKSRHYERKLKRNKQLVQSYKEAKDKYPSILDYIEAHLKLAMAVYLSHELGAVNQPFEYLKQDNSLNHEIALLFYDMIEQTKAHHLTFNQWGQQLFEEVDLQAYSHQVTSVKKQQV